jgi:MFS family permease
VGYFLLPFFILLVLEMLEEESVGWKWFFYIALVTLGINLQGAAHFFIYCMIFLLLLGIFQPRFFSTVFRAVIISALVSMMRILPPALQFVGGTGLESLTGFNSVLEVFQVLINQSSRGYWEKTYYIGLLGFVFIFYFGIMQHWMKDERHHPIYLPALVMTFFSIGSMYLPFFNSGIPFLDSQRAVSRFIIVPLVFMMMLAGIQFQSLLNLWTQKAWEKGAMVVLGLALMAYDLLLNTRIWSLDNVSSSMRATEVIEVSVATYSYPFYETILILGSICTVLSLGALIFLTYQERKRVR